MKAYKSQFSKDFKEYFEFRLALGFAMRNTSYVFVEFDEFIFKNYPKQKFISRKTIIEYLATTKHLHTTSRNYRVTLLRVFCKYLYQKDQRTYIPEPRLLKSGKRKLTPYIFNSEEIQAILEHLRSSTLNKKISALTYTTAIGLLYSTGLRIGEICRLNLEDVEIKNKRLLIKRSKFYKSRIVPISQSVTEVLKKYKLKRLGHWRTTDPKEPFFVGMTGKRLHENHISRKFRQTLKDLSIVDDFGKRPRLHDLRHSFATNTLQNIYRDNKSPEAYLPALATYMGHVNLTYTQTYLSPTNSTMALASDRFNKFIKN